MGNIYQKAELTDCELTTMKIVWDAEEPITCPEIISILSSKYGLNYKDTTVYTFLKNLKDKGFVDSYRKGITFFVPLRSEEEYRTEVIKHEEKFWFNGDFFEFIVALGEINDIDPSDLEKLKKMHKKYVK